MGCEARKLPASGEVFFLDFSFYRTYQEELTILGLRFGKVIAPQHVSQPSNVEGDERGFRVACVPSLVFAFVGCPSALDSSVAHQSSTIAELTIMSDGWVSSRSVFPSRSFPVRAFCATNFVCLKAPLNRPRRWGRRLAGSLDKTLVHLYAPSHQCWSHGESQVTIGHLSRLIIDDALSIALEY